MKVGDLIRYRERENNDPPWVPRGEGACWGEVLGIVIETCKAGWDSSGPESAIKYMNGVGDIVLAPIRYMEVISAS